MKQYKWLVVLAAMGCFAVSSIRADENEGAAVSEDTPAVAPAPEPAAPDTNKDQPVAAPTVPAVPADTPAVAPPAEPAATPPAEPAPVTPVEPPAAPMPGVGDAK